MAEKNYANFSVVHNPLQDSEKISLKTAAQEIFW